LIDDFDGTISDVRFIMTDYDGNTTDAVPVAKVVFDVDGEETDSLYSVGGNNDYAPDEAGKRLVKLKSRNSLNKTSKFGMFLLSVVEAGFPLNRMDDSDIGYLVGLDGHFLRKVVEYKGLKKKGDRDSTVLVCTKINSLPGEGPPTSTKGRAKKATGTKAAAAVSTELAEAVSGIIQGVIIGEGGDLSKKKMLSALFKSDEMNALGDKKVALKMAADDTFLKSQSEVWTYEDGMLKLA